MAIKQRGADNSQGSRICEGGLSFNRRKEEHFAGKIPDVLCYRCKTRMGCSVCCESPRELICLVCHNWAAKAGVRFHGNVVPSAKVPKVMTDSGLKTWDGHYDDRVERAKAEVNRAFQRIADKVEAQFEAENLKKTIDKTPAQMREETDRRQYLQEQKRKLWD